MTAAPAAYYDTHHDVGEGPGDRDKLCDICHVNPAEIYMWDEITDSSFPEEIVKKGEKHYAGMICRPCMERMQEQSKMTDEQKELWEQMKEYAKRQQQERGEG